MSIKYYPPKGAKHRKKRVGCGPSSGHGKTSTRGHKGSGQRKGKEYDSRFEGGQMPLYRRIPKRGFKSLRKVEYETVNFRDIIRAGLKGEITPEILKSAGLIKKNLPIKILGTGDLTEPFVIKAHAISSSALKKLTAVGGKFEAIPFK
ncbi:MAG: 50S ribosomal protein L15 [candidate division WOR-3 bacterium]|nr:50S ribosomal protein L15 [candidate division WOR-3 bacterium]MCX7757713.1 50S ribosomal protein L15 [candidate division WOR-3 bacterium]MDW7988092.1 50S ribosomal protein L15 [candidate division WOR-3 bacterium]